MAEFYRKKKKVCQMCAGKTVDYKDAEIIKKYVSADKGKILPRRVKKHVLWQFYHSLNNEEKI